MKYRRASLRIRSLTEKKSQSRESDASLQQATPSPVEQQQPPSNLISCGSSSFNSTFLNHSISSNNESSSSKYEPSLCTSPIINNDQATLFASKSFISSINSDTVSLNQQQLDRVKPNILSSTLETKSIDTSNIPSSFVLNDNNSNQCTSSNFEIDSTCQLENCSSSTQTSMNENGSSSNPSNTHPTNSCQPVTCRDEKMYSNSDEVLFKLKSIDLNASRQGNLGTIHNLNEPIAFNSESVLFHSDSKNVLSVLEKQERKPLEDSDSKNAVTVLEQSDNKPLDDVILPLNRRCSLRPRRNSVCFNSNGRMSTSNKKMTAVVEDVSNELKNHTRKPYTRKSVARRMCKSYTKMNERCERNVNELKETLKDLNESGEHENVSIANNSTDACVARNSGTDNDGQTRSSTPTVDDNSIRSCAKRNGRNGGCKSLAWSSATFNQTCSNSNVAALTPVKLKVKRRDLETVYEDPKGKGFVVFSKTKYRRSILLGADSKTKRKIDLRRKNIKRFCLQNALKRLKNKVTLDELQVKLRCLDI